MPCAHAADATDPGGDGGLQEVVVTAQKTSENLQTVPISVEVLSAEKLQQLDIVDLDDYVKYSPSVSYARGIGQGGNAQPGSAHIYMRGVVSGGDGNHSGPQPSVGMYFDEQPVTTIDGTLDMHIYDVNRIEVLEGPQGTLYGASSESGTIRIISNQPDPTKFAAGYQLDGNMLTRDSNTGYQAEGFINIPLSDWAAVRLVAWDEHDAGFISNVAGTNAAACIQNGVRTFPSWSGEAGGSPYPCPAPGVIGAGAITNTAYRANDYNTVDTLGGRAAAKFDLGRELDHHPHGDGPDPAHQRLLRLRPGRRRSRSHALLAGKLPGLLDPDGAHRRGQVFQLRPGLLRFLPQAQRLRDRRLQRLFGVL